jgi:hypothetical protein
MKLISSPARDPRALILAFVKQRSFQDTFECISICDDARILSDNRMKILEATGKGTWLLIQYLQPCGRAARSFNDIRFVMATGLVNSPFRLIVNCQTFAFFSLHFVMRTWLLVEPFPSLKVCVRSLGQMRDRKDNI